MSILTNNEQGSDKRISRIFVSIMMIVVIIVIITVAMTLIVLIMITEYIVDLAC